MGIMESLISQIRFILFIFPCTLILDDIIISVVLMTATRWGPAMGSTCHDSSVHGARTR